MGCVSSRTDINDLHPNIFKVMNVDEQGQLVSPGQLELTETEMVLYQRGKSTTRWPLAYIRRYGFESELFSFESGRRCPTGPGIFAFRCRRAEQLFNLLHQHIAIQCSQSEDVNHTPSDFPIPLVSSGPVVPVRPLTQTTDASYLEPLPTRLPVTRTHSVGFTRLNSVSSNGPTSPSAITPPPMTSPEPAPEHNNNKRASLSLQHSYINTLLPNETEAGSTSQPYMNLDRPVSPSPSTSSDTLPTVNTDGHLYMNITPGEVAIPLQVTPAPPIRQSVPDSISASSAVYLPNDISMASATLPLFDETEEDPRHCYANLDTDEIEGFRNIMISSDNVQQLPLPATPTGVPKEVIYADLVLGKTKDVCLPVVPPESPKQPAKGYTIIDFNKTVAVSQIVKPSQDLNSEGSRKTRHNSTISELAQTSTRHSSSLSD